MFLKRVSISNLRSIGEIRLDFAAEDGVRSRTVLLGENGCGKSTVLRAVALVLAGSDALAMLLRDPASWVRLGKKVATIEAVLETMAGDERTARLELRREWNLRETLKHNEEGLSMLDAALRHATRNWFMIGYGVTRRPAESEFSSPTPSSMRGGMPEGRAGNVATLFEPDAALVSFEQWAMDLEYRRGDEALVVLRKAMKSLLPGMEFHAIDRRRRQVLFKTVDGVIPFRQLSDGYQNVANWCGDMLYGITSAFEDHKRPLETRGLLLVDELDLHLHPVWQRKLLGFLGKALPNMQILATSHSPLIAQQLREGELYVVERSRPRQGAGLRAVSGDPSLLTLPQLLSPMFGIESAESVRVQKIRKRARGAKSVSAADRAVLAEVSVLDSLPESVREQVRAAEELNATLAKVTGVEQARLDPERLRKRLANKITLE